MDHKKHREMVTELMRDDMSTILNENRHCAALIVAAGLSSRMREFKPMLPFADSTLIRTVISKLKIVGCDPVILVTGHRGDELYEHVSDLNIKQIHNPDYAVTDMFTSVKLGLAALPGGLDRFFFLPGDIPLFSPATLLAMLNETAQRDRRVVIPVHQGRKGHPILIRSDQIPWLLAYTGPMGLKGALNERGPELFHLKVNDPGITLDADFPQDYQDLLERLKCDPDSEIQR